ncbi:type IV toxin-antitoxin system AbiEi family antitoxin domain-containing protein [Arthrobacter antibioticus]|uniref:type IV toxin-antitoxin system AbiEi family antitoxin domain-containing protein n=1 Tax=Arthrobacter sp. H35-MC1 TaxID=3046203 RepID=UPI0024BB6FB7|nr:type IV toxin-antitoxin system AbiEi family antitoxin domain-containing protein [Arthrobacter sp. H35-MC1]MDJ0318534.1 hypothetical protein [Arthrobacter sp. H35-MC1]
METSELAIKIDHDWPSGTIIATSAELAGVGLSPRLLAAAVKSGLLLRIRHGAYTKMAQWQGKFPSEKDALRIAAHFKATRGNSLYSHVSAARLLGLYVWNADAIIHVTTPSSCSATSAVPGVRVHRRALEAGAHQQIRHPRLGTVRVTRLEQTIVDCARTESFVTAVIIGDCGLHNGASLEVMHQLLSMLTGRRGVRAARRVLEALSIGSESAGETRLRLAVAEMDVPQPEYQVWLRAAGNNYRVDGAWRDIKLALEFDGKTKYFAYKRTEDAIYEERLRERELMEEGWSFLRVEWKHLAEREWLERRILASRELARRRNGLQ